MHLSKHLIRVCEDIIFKVFFYKVKITNIIILSKSSSRNLVARLYIDKNKSGIDSFILKLKNLSEKDNASMLNIFAHEWCSYEFLTRINSNYHPKFHGGSFKNNCILLEDFGDSSQNIKKILLNEPSIKNIDMAIHTLNLTMSSLAKLHAITMKREAEFQDKLLKTYKHANTFTYDNKHIEDFIAKIRTIFQKYTLSLPSSLVSAELMDILSFNSIQFKSLIHGDLCLDNIYLLDNIVKFIDFEYGNFINPLFDTVSFRMGFPSCECFGVIPKKIIKDIEDVYRRDFLLNISEELGQDIYTQQKVAACGIWVIRSLLMLDTHTSDQTKFINAKKKLGYQLVTFIEVANETGYYLELAKCLQDLYMALSNLNFIEKFNYFPVFQNYM